jgi:hypothetical protein
MYRLDGRWKKAVIFVYVKLHRVFGGETVRCYDLVTVWHRQIASWVLFPNMANYSEDSVIQTPLLQTLSWHEAL